jgi:hypothetical protein
MKRNCEQCAAEFNKSPAAIARGEGRFCSNVCRKEYLRLHPRLGEKAPVWKGGVHQENRRQRGRIFNLLHRDKCRAYDAVKYALKKGRLQKGACQHCGATEHVHAHHEDYSKPLDVIWLCPSCHLDEHGLKIGARPLNRTLSRERQRQKREAVKLATSLSD